MFVNAAHISKRAAVLRDSWRASPRLERETMLRALDRKGVSSSGCMGHAVFGVLVKQTPSVNIQGAVGQRSGAVPIYNTKHVSFRIRCSIDIAHVSTVHKASELADWTILLFSSILLIVGDYIFVG